MQHWAEAGIDAQLKGMKTSLQLTADQEKDWGSFKSAVKDAQKARLTGLQKEQSSGLTPMDRLNAKAERLAEAEAGLEDRRGSQSLYLSLDDTSARISGRPEPAEGNDSKEPLPPPMAKPRSKRFAAS